MSSRRSTLATVAALVIAVGAHWKLADLEIWYPAEGEAAADTGEYIEVNVEETYYRQFSLLNDQFEKLEPGTPGKPEYYFVGFGSYADQNVFANEIKHIRKLFDDRFLTKTRSVALINNYETGEEYPLANVSNLKLSLDMVASRMNVEEDVLFLYLTSHGSRDHYLAVDFYPLQLNPMHAEDLALLLDESGIKWRVVVVSACFSGGFVDALANDNTLVVTAAAADRTSFGCSNNNEFTWFGEAYFDQALRKTHSLEQAFEVADAQIKKREAEHDYEHSNPQFKLGPRMAEKLAEITTVLNQSAPNPQHAPRRTPAHTPHGD